jgi:hypothetical protein
MLGETILYGKSSQDVNYCNLLTTIHAHLPHYLRVEVV